MKFSATKTYGGYYYRGFKIKRINYVSSTAWRIPRLETAKNQYGTLKKAKSDIDKALRANINDDIKPISKKQYELLKEIYQLSLKNNNTRIVTFERGRALSYLENQVLIKLVELEILDFVQDETGFNVDNTYYIMNPFNIVFENFTKFNKNWANDVVGYKGLSKKSSDNLIKNIAKNL
jgi:hypothetical protein